MFIDESVITVISGNGGDGAATFRREKFVQFGGPDGGDGGKGGDVVFIADPNINTLVDFKSSKKFQAGNGEKGSAARCKGKSGEDLIIKVPVGTMIRDFETNRLLLDLDNPNERVIFLKGGDESFVIADVPGLIEGAHEGVGLGDRFLKHIERCKLIIHIVDISGIDGREPEEDFLKINRELRNYSEKLSNKIQIVAANKIDMLYDEEKYDKFEKFVKEQGIEYVYPISVIANEGIKPILKKAWELIQEIPREELEEEYSVEELLRENSKKEPWIIKKLEDHVFEVDGRIVDDVLRKYVFTGDDGIINFLQMMRNLGMEVELENAGVEEGDLIIIAGYEFEYVI